MYRPSTPRRPTPLAPYRPPTRRSAVGYADEGHHSGAYHQILESIAHARRDKDILDPWLHAKDLHSRGQLSEREFTQVRLAAEWVLMVMAHRDPTFEMPEGLREVGGPVAIAGVRGAYRPKVGSMIGRSPTKKRAPVRKAVAKKKAAPKRPAAKKTTKRAPAKKKAAPKRKAAPKTKTCASCHARNAKSSAFCAKCGRPLKSRTAGVAGSYRPASKTPSYRSPLMLDSRIHEVPAPRHRR